VTSEVVSAPASSHPTAAPDSPLVRFARPSNTPGLELVHYPNLTCGWRGIPDSYTWFTMIDRLEGDVEVISRGVRAQCAPGSLTIGEPGEPYVLRPRSEMRGEFRVVRVDNALLYATTGELGVHAGESPFPREPLCRRPLAQLFARFYEAIARGEKLETQERLFAFLASLVGLGARPVAPNGTRNAQGVCRAREVLHAQFDTLVSLDELAQAANMDKFGLLRAFSNELGITPHAYQVQLRMARACRLIAQRVPLAEVAQIVGYSEQSALQRPFKRLIGVTPGAYAGALH